MLLTVILTLPFVAAGPMVTTNYGSIEGFTYQTKDKVSADIFLNIPFAQPPVNELRFEKPRPPHPWQGVLNATSLGPSCWTHARVAAPDPSSEDCLQLNIIRPSEISATSKLPVLIWIHGGGYEVGSAVMYGYEGFANIYAPHDIIVVSVQYRLGPLGFFSTGDSEMPGNLGMWDQVQSLRWLYENIEYFGGDKHKLIVWGLSAGAGSASALTISPHSRDMIYASIEHSGSTWAGFAIGHNVPKFSKELAKELGCTKNVKECLKRKTMDEIFDAVDTTGESVDAIGCLKYTPVIDGDFMPGTPDEVLRGAPPKPTLVSITKKEANFFTAFGKLPSIHQFTVDMNNKEQWTREHLISRIEHQLMSSDRFTCQHEDALQKVVDHYVDKKYKNGFGSDYFIDQYTEFVSDTMFFFPILEGGLAKRDANWPIYLYQLNHASDSIYPEGFPERMKGAPHALDWSYISDLHFFGKFDAYSEEELPITLAQQNNIIAFAKTGKALFPDVGTNKNFLGYYDISPEQQYHKKSMHPGVVHFWRGMRKYGFDVATLTPMPSANATCTH